MEFVDVSHHFGGLDGQTPIAVLTSISLVVEPASMTCVAGRSGSGKTTLLNLAAGLLLPSEGDVLWDGETTRDLAGSQRAEFRRRRLGIVFQNGALIPSLTAAENVALPEIPRAVRSSGRAHALALLELVGLGQRAAHLPSRLSGGEQQRVAVARALYNDPAILLVDEPTANLDRATADSIIDLLLSLRDEGRTLLVATHDERLVGRADQLHHLDG